MGSRRLALALLPGLIAACKDPQPADKPEIADAAPKVCPTHLELELIGPSSRFDPGYSGLAHGLGLAVGSDLTVKTADCDPECRRCRFTGPVRPVSATKQVIPQRCRDDATKTCTADADCGVGGACRFMFPPIAANVIAATCSIVYFEPLPGANPEPFQGVIDLATGEVDAEVMNMKVKAALGSCSTCNMDPTSFDGIKGGTCSTSPTTCDVHGSNGTSTTSFDCPIGASIVDLPLPIRNVSTGARTWTLDATRPKCTLPMNTSQRCWCGMCSDGTPCSSDAGCASGSCGVASGPGGMYGTRNHACGAGGCMWDPTTQRGRCSNGTACFPDDGTIQARGNAQVRDGVFISQLAGIVCMPPFNNALIDPNVGLPGPLFFEARFRISPRVVPPRADRSRSRSRSSGVVRSIRRPRSW